MSSSLVLLIEDDMWLADSYRAVIEERGFACTLVPTAEEAMETINAGIPDAIVADIMLGDRTVITLLHELQSYRDTQHIPVIICSSLAKSAAHVSEQLRAYGVVEILDKSTVTPEILVAAVEEYGRNARS